MGLLSNALAVLAITIKRLWTHLGLMLCVAIGLVVAVAIVVSVPLYSDAVNYRALRNNLFKDQTQPPFSFVYRYVGAWSGPIEWSDYHPADEYMINQVPGIIGLPLQHMGRHVRTDRFRLFPASAAAYGDTRKPLEWINVGYLSGLQDHVEIMEGRFPRPAAAGDPSFEVLIHEGLANALGLQAGEGYVLFGGVKEGGLDQPVQLTTHIAGVWRPLNPRDPFWFYPAHAFEKTFLVPEGTFVRYIAPNVKDEVNLAVWHMIFDGQGIHTEDVPPLLRRINSANAGASNVLSELALDFSPVEALQEYRKTALLLTILLYVFAIPVVGLVLYFVVLISGMIVQRQRYEIAILRSRGIASAQVVGIYLLEGMVLGALALVIGPLVARLLAQIMGNTRSFLSFTPRAPLPLRFTARSLQIGAGMVAAGLAASLIPALSASKYTIVTHKQEVARSFQKPFWQRHFVDLMLLVPPLYGYYLLRQRGTISVLGRELGHGSDPFQNPLLFLVPTLFLLATALLFIRVFPLLMEVLARLSSRLSGTATVLALRHLARSSSHYTGPLLLIVLTLGLATFSASMAKTLDGHLVDRTYYEVGADIRLVEAGGSPPEEQAKATGASAETEGEDEEEALRWLFLPVSEHLTIPGVKGAARVGDYAATALVVSGEKLEGRFLGIDRADFAEVAFFRRDFSPSSFGALMNALALQSQALLVSEPFLQEHGLDIGDRIKLRLFAFGDSKDVIFTVAGALNYFPAAYPEEGPFFVGNLDYFFQEMGRQYPYDVWLATDGRDAQQIIRGVEDLGLRVISSQDSRGTLEREEAKPEQGGTFGLLSIGFVTAVALTVLGFLIYSVISFRERFIELGVLRAIGLSVRQMAAFLASEQLILIAIGLGVGTGLGIWTSKLFIPFLQVRGSPHPQTPPFIVRIAWDNIYKIYAIFGAMMVLAIAIMLSSLVRMKIFQAIKLGETA